MAEPRTSWEFKVHEATITDRWTSKKQAEEVADFERGLNALGSEGWDMVTYQAVPLTGKLTAQIKGYAYLAIMKRPT